MSMSSPPSGAYQSRVRRTLGRLGRSPSRGKHTAKSPELVNSRMGYVAISRGSHDVQLFTNNAGELASKLGRGVTPS